MGTDLKYQDTFPSVSLVGTKRYGNATGFSAVARAGVSGFGEEESRGEPGSGVGAGNRPADLGDRFFETVLAAHRRIADAAGVNWKAAIYQQFRQEMSANELAIESMCTLAGVSRRGFYRFDPDAKPAERDMDPRDAIQRIALECRELWAAADHRRVAAPSAGW